MIAPVSASECARQLGVSVNTILRRHEAGEITSEFHSGRVIRFDVAKVKKQLSEKTPKPKPTGLVPVY